MSAIEDSPQQMVLNVSISKDGCSGVLRYGLGKPTSGVRFRSKIAGKFVAARIIAHGRSSGNLSRDNAEQLGSSIGHVIAASDLVQGQSGTQLDQLNWFQI